VAVEVAVEVAVMRQTARYTVATHQTWATHVVTTRQFATVPRIEHVLPTVRLWTATQYDWTLMRGLLAVRTSGEVGYVLHGLSVFGATATATNACRGDRDVRGTTTKPNKSMEIQDSF